MYIINSVANYLYSNLLLDQLAHPSLTQFISIGDVFLLFYILTGVSLMFYFNCLSHKTINLKTV